MHVPQTEVILRLDGAELARVTLPPGEYVIGRSREADIRAGTPQLSGSHALLTINYDHLLIEDLGSSNGTFVGEEPISEPTRLFPNQPVRLGDVIVEVHRERVPDSDDVTLAPMQSAVRRALPREVLSEKRYAIRGMIASGGMGAILEARQNAISRKVAMKVMLESGKPVDALRFIDEAKITGQLEHPNIVPIYELGVDANDQLFYTMKLVRGITLKKVLDQLIENAEEAGKRYPLPVLLTVFQKACDAVAFAHSKGVIHRDLKPENLMLGDFGEVLVMDWGLAKAVGKNAATAYSARSLVAAPRDPETGFGGTLAGAIMGTPQYMAPEQAAGEIESLDARTDIYALGAILFEILNLRRAITGQSAQEIVEKVRCGEIAWPDPKAGPVKLKHLPGGRVPESLHAIMLKAMALKPSGRYQSVKELQADLTAYQNGFATSAEEKTAWKQFKLLLKRQRAVASSIGVALAVLAAVVSAAFVRIAGERNRAERALTDLRKTAPALTQQAALLVEERDFAGALIAIQAAARIAPEGGGLHLHRAHILQSLRRFDESAAAYTEAARYGETRVAAEAGSGLSLELAAEQRNNGKLSPQTLLRWHGQLLSESRVAEAVALVRDLGRNAKELRATVEAVLKKTGWKNASIHGQRGDGPIHLYLRGEDVTDLSPLAGLPIYDLNLDGTGIRDLSVVASLPLERLRVADAKFVDFNTLRGAKFDDLSIHDCLVRELSWLEGMALRRLKISGNGSEPTNGDALRGMPLKYVHVDRGHFDLSVLAESPVEELFIHHWQSGLKGVERLRLRRLDIWDSKIVDLSPLAGMPLQEFVASYTNVKDLSPIASAPLEVLFITGTKVTDLTPLRGKPLKKLNFEKTHVKDVSLLLDMPALEEAMIPQTGTNIRMLRKHKTLKLLGWEGDWDFSAWRPKKTVIEFWADWDADPRREEEEKRIEQMRVDREKRLEQVRTALAELGIVPQALTIRDIWGVCLELNGRPITDVSPLRSLPVDHLSLYGTGVTDITPLRGALLREITFDHTEIKDVSPLLGMPNLESAMIPEAATNIEILRSHKTLKYLGWEGDFDVEAWHPRLTADEFWDRYDRRKAAGKK